MEWTRNPRSAPAKASVEPPESKGSKLGKSGRLSETGGPALAVAVRVTLANQRRIDRSFMIVSFVYSSQRGRFPAQSLRLGQGIIIENTRRAIRLSNAQATIAACRGCH